MVKIGELGRALHLCGFAVGEPADQQHTSHNGDVG
jgi:hypothetical protein